MFERFDEIRWFYICGGKRKNMIKYEKLIHFEPTIKKDKKYALALSGIPEAILIYLNYFEFNTKISLQYLFFLFWKIWFQ